MLIYTHTYKCRHVYRDRTIHPYHDLHLSTHQGDRDTNWVTYRVCVCVCVCVCVYVSVSVSFTVSVSVSVCVYACEWVGGWVGGWVGAPAHVCTSREGVCCEGR